MKIVSICVTLFFILIISSCSTQRTESSVPTVSVEVPFEMKVGETVSIEGHQFTFSQVRSDSRCPMDAQCIWAGEATVVLTPVDEADLNFKEVLLSTNSTEAYTYLFPDNTNNTVCSEEGMCTTSSNLYTYGYLIQLNSLSPLPQTGEELSQEDYIATFTIYLSA